MPVIILGLLAAALIFLQNFTYKRLWSRGLSYSVRFGEKEAFEGDIVSIREELVNRKLLPLPWVHAKFHVSANLEPLQSSDAGESIFSIMPYTVIRTRKKLNTKRGVYRLHNAELSAGDLLHISRYEKNYKQHDELLVFPKLSDDAPELDMIKSAIDSLVLSSRIINPDPFEFKGIREYSPTDPLKAVNFKASAVAGQLMVNIYAPTDAKRLTLMLNMDCENPDILAEEYEQMIRVCATLARRYIESGVETGFITNGRDTVTAKNTRLAGGLNTAHLYKIYECLARVSVGHPFRPMATELDDLKDRERVYVLLSPQISPQSDGVQQALANAKNRGITVYCTT